MKKTVIFYLFFISFFIIGVCFAEDPDPGEKINGLETVSLTLNVETEQTGNMFNGKESDIKRMQISVFADSITYIDPQDMTPFEGGWKANLNNLPVGFELTFEVNAYNSKKVVPANKIFYGKTIQALSGVDDQVTVHLNPVNTGIALPVIYKIARSADTVVSSDSKVTVHIGGNSGETIKWQIISDGTFDAASGTVVLKGDGSGEFGSKYTAPNIKGTYTHKVKLTNSLGNSVTASFDTHVVEEVGPIVIVPIHLPIITKLDVELSGSDLIWTAVHDDASTELLTYRWSYDGKPSLSFEDATANPAVMKDYDPASSGTLSLSVSDASGGNTQITVRIPENLFPSDMINDTVQKPLGFIVTPGSGKNTLSWAEVKGATSYNIYFESTPGVTYKFHPDFTTTDPTYDHIDLSAQTYYYRVAAVGDWGEGQLSVEKSGTPTVKPGRDDHALDFDGSDDYTTHGSLDLSISNNATVSAWIHPTEDNGVIVMQGLNHDGNENGWVLAIREDGSESSETASGEIVWASHDANNGMLIRSPTTVTLNQWQHVAATKNGTEVKLYLNGELVHTESLETAAIAYNDSFELSIGKQIKAQDRPFFESAFQGKIDEVQIWNVTLPDAEIKEYMNTCLAGDEPGLVGYYKFNDGPGSTTLTDSTPNANHGTLKNMDENTDWVLDPAGVCGVFGTGSV